MQRKTILLGIALVLMMGVTAVVWAAGEYLIILDPGEHVDIVCTSDVYSVAPHGEGVRFGCFEPVPPCEPFPRPDGECEANTESYPVYLPIVEMDDATD